jgi:hypothetical protein
MHIVLIILAAIPALILLLLAVGLVVAFIDHLLHPHGYDATAQKIRVELQQILDEGADGWTFDDFTSIGPLKDPRFEAIRQRVAHLDEEFPPESDKEFFGPKGAEVIRGFIRELEHETAA